MTGQDLGKLIARTPCIVLDFDGPVCGIFANHPAPQVANQLRRELIDQGVTLPEAIRGEPDPLEVLRYCATLGRPAIVRRIEDALRAAELDAVRCAEPTPYGREVIVAAWQTGRRVAVVSNNSAPAVTAYLTAHRLNRYVHPIIGRTYAAPDQMKPNPAPLLAAADELDSKPRDCVLIGDSPTDIEAAHAAGVYAIGYANRPDKYHLLSAADALIGSMAELADVLIGES